MIGLNILFLVAICFLAHILSYFLTRYWLRYSYQLNRMDTPGERSAHKIPTPTSGGIGLVSAALLFFIIGLLFIPHTDVMPFIVYIIMSGALAVMGFFDDQYDLSIKVRFGLQFIAAIAMVVVAEPITEIYIPLLGTLSLAPWVAGLGFIIWIVGFTNMFNFMDGIDGLSGSHAAIASVGWFVLLLVYDDQTMMLLAGIIFAACLGFLYLNWPPAKLFMGDIGSNFLGFTLAVFPLLVEVEGPVERLPLVTALFVFPFVYDATLTIFRRGLRRENIFAAHFTHLYQRLIKTGFQHQVVTRIYIGLSASCVLIGLIYLLSNQPYIQLMAIILSIVELILFTVFVSQAQFNYESNR